MIDTDFYLFQKVLKCCGVITASFNQNSSKFVPSFWLLLYSLVFIFSHQIMLIINHNNLVFQDFSKSLSLKEVLYTFDVGSWLLTTIFFMIINIQRFKSKAKVLNKILAIDSTFGHLCCSYTVDNQLRRKLCDIFKAIVAYAMLTLVINILASKDDVFNSSSFSIRITFYISTALLCLSRSLFDTFLILKISLSLSGIAKNVENIKYQEQVYDILTAFDECHTIINIFDKQFTVSIIIEVLNSFLLFCLVTFYNFDTILKWSVNFDEFIALMNTIVWIMLLFPTYLNCSIYGGIQCEVCINNAEIFFTFFTMKKKLINVHKNFCIKLLKTP